MNNAFVSDNAVMDLPPSGTRDDSAAASLAPSVKRDGAQPSSLAIWAAAAVVAVCVLCDFFMAPGFMRVRQNPAGIAASWFFALVGCTLAQGNLLAAWLVWSEGPFLRRLLLHWGVAGLLCWLWIAGLAFSARQHDSAMVGSIVVLAVPLVSIAAQLPLWIARLAFGWRIVRQVSEVSTIDEEPLTIRGLMLATLLVAVAFGLARLMPNIPRGKEAALGPPLLLTAAISTIAMLPAGRLLLGMRRLGHALTWSVVYAALLIGLVGVVVELQIRFAPSSLAPYFAYVWLSSLMLGFAATLMLTGIVARAFGYRLARGRRRLST
jgi:hypothetical protein